MDNLSSEMFVNTDIFNGVPLNSPAEFDDIDDVFNEIELPDGSTIFELNPTEEVDVLGVFDDDFYANIADKVGDGKLDEIATQVLDGIEQDKQSREDWESASIKGMKYLGFKLEDAKDVPFMSACRAFDTTFSNALLKFWSTYKSELFPDEGPASAEIRGEKNDFLQHKADNIKDGLNYYLTEFDREYYPDRERLLVYLALVGCAFTKTYQDPISHRPISRFIDPNDFLINNNCVSILSSSRLTQRERLTKKEIKLRQKSGFYRDIELPGVDDDDDDDKTRKKINNLQGIDLDAYEQKGLYQVFESHVDLDDVEENKDDKESFPKPYIVSICKTSRKVLSLRRNWQEGDDTYKRIEYFTQYNFIPGFGIYGVGLTQLIGSNAIVLTSLLRQLVDAGTLENFPGGLMVKGTRPEQNDKPVGPAEFRQVETGGLPIQQCFMPMPYKGPSPVLKDLRNEIADQSQMLVNTVESQIAEGNPNAPVGTTLALLEVSSKVQSSVFSSLRKSLGNELTLVYDLFKKTLSDNPFSFKLPGKNIVLTREDFVDDIVIVPNSDPKLTTSAQRIIYAEAKIRMAQSAPQIHDMRAVYKGFYNAIGMSDQEVDMILPPEQKAVPLDPISDIMNAMQDKPIVASIEQDHQAHIITKMPFAQNPIIAADIKQHEAFQYLIDMQMAMGMQMPDPQMLQDPQVQNQIALMAAQATQEMMAQQQAANPPPLDPNQVMMANIENEAKIAEMKATTEVFKSQLDFEKEKMKTEANLQIAEEKNEKDLALAEMKQQQFVS